MKNFLTLILTCSLQFAVAQIDFTPYPGTITHCPAQLIKYTSSVQVGGCGIRTWTVTNGIILDPSTNAEVTTITGNSVDVRWDNIAAVGKLKVTVTCGSETYVEEKNYVIRSVTGVAPQNFRLVSAAVPLCSTNPVILTLDHMFVPNQAR